MLAWNNPDPAAWMERYVERHTGIRHGSVEDGRFLVWRCRPLGVCGGLGNRIVNIVAAFALAILTDRAFLIDYPGSSPLELEAFARSEVIDWRMPAWFEHSAFSAGSVAVGIHHDEPLVTEHIARQRREHNKQVNIRYRLRGMMTCPACV